MKLHKTEIVIIFWAGNRTEKSFPAKVKRWTKGSAKGTTDQKNLNQVGNNHFSVFYPLPTLRPSHHPTKSVRREPARNACL